MDEPQRISTIARAIRFVRRYFVPIVVLIFLIWTAGFYEFGRYSVYRAHPELVQAEQATAILNKVGQLIQLPQNETPTMATITNAASIKQTQPFLANAENGDVLIVYPNAQEALLYRPSTNKLIAVGPVDNSAPSTSAVSIPVQSDATSTDNATTTKTKN